VHFDPTLFDAPDAVGRPLTLVASDTDVGILAGAAEIARQHPFLRPPSHSRPGATRRMSRRRCTPSARHSTPCARAGWPWPSRKAKTC
jgi:hypothetical protein